MFRTAISALLLGTAAADWASRDAIPSGCLPATKVQNGGRCLFSDQCASDWCCPYFKSCLGSMSASVVSNDPVRSAIMYGVGGAQSGMQRAGNTGHDVCSSKANADIGLCNAEVGNPVTPSLTAGSWDVPYDITHADCNCDSRMVEQYNAGTWTGHFDSSGTFVNACPNSVPAGGSSSGGEPESTNGTAAAPGATAESSYAWRRMAPAIGVLLACTTATMLLFSVRL